MKKRFQPIVLLQLLFGISAGHVTAQIKTLSLQEAVQLASTGNRTVQINVLKNMSTAEAAREARSYLQPTVSFNSNYSYYTERQVIFLRNEATASKLDAVKFGGRYSLDGSITASYPLVNPVYKSNIKSAELSHEIQQQQTKNTGEQLSLEVAQHYLAALLYKERVAVLKQSLSRNERALKDSRSLFLQGKNLKTDTLANYISVQNLLAAISALDNNIQVISVQLKQLIGLDNSVQLQLTDSLSAVDRENPIMVSSSAFSVALDNRKDVKVQQLVVDQKKEEINKARALFKPQLWALGQYQLQTQGDQAKFWNNSFPRTSFVGLKLSIPIYSGNRQKYKVSQAELELRQNQLAYEELKSAVETELLTFFANLREAYNQCRISREKVGAAQVGYTMMNERYRHGLGNRLELTDAELSLTNARLEYLQSVYNTRVIEFQYKKSMGVLSRDEVRL